MFCTVYTRLVVLGIRGLSFHGVDYLRSQKLPTNHDSQEIKAHISDFDTRVFRFIRNLSPANSKGNLCGE